MLAFHEIVHRVVRCHPLLPVDKTVQFRHMVILLNKFQDAWGQSVADLWNTASYRVIADGGLHCYHRAKSYQLKMPDVICGDFDSVSKGILNQYMTKGIKLVHLTDESETDFTKSVRMVDVKIKDKMIDCNTIFALGSHAGRPDHTLAIYHTLYKFRNPYLPIFFLSEDETCTWIINETEIRLDDDFKKYWCGIIPAFGRVERVNTTGFKYNIINEPMQSGLLISTSNKFDRNMVEIETSGPLLFMMGRLDQEICN
ncbi:Thiamin pyrophosphokinase 1 [Thelohanellus kitauei]|uniref:Thiamin pyrophosphokinase 1 n=1 Tax=Thelohanellus kitauei TaxID=669202 RepID=A0A0C2MY34_THEKT|nr:Thiamin pyrophosphokinase 1 [Thelohanellus kitauei]